MRRSLEWACNRIRADLDIVRELVARKGSGPGGLRIAATTHGAEERKRKEASAAHETGADYTRGPRDGTWDEYAQADAQQQVVGDRAPTSASIYGSMQAPRPRSRQLPSPSMMSMVSPSSATFPTSAVSHSPVSAHTLAPISPATPAPASGSAQAQAQAAHLQDLQRQVSTKTLALQTLQEEHDRILAALSRAQSRCGTLEKRSQASDNEIGSLSEERSKLQMQADALDGQVEELTRARDEAREQSVIKGAQYLKIVAMASQLEARGAADNRRWKAEKAAMERRLVELGVSEAEVAAVVNRTLERATAPSLAASVEALQAEVAQLRDGCRTVETALRTLDSAGARVERVIRRVGDIAEEVGMPGSDQSLGSTTTTAAPSAGSRKLAASTEAPEG